MTSWWNNNAKERINDFKVWTGDFNQPSKVYFRQHVINNNYQSIIDCGCGLAEDFFGFQQDQYKIEYTGLDSCQFFIETNKSKNINMVKAELDGNLPLSDSIYDCVYCREVLEHLPHYKNALPELIRIAKKEVIIVFFIPPGETEEINYWQEQDLYHNKYSLSDIESYLSSNSKVKEFSWKNIDDIGYAPVTNEADNNEDVAVTESIKETLETLENFNNNDQDNTVVVSTNVLVPKKILHIFINNN